MNAPTVVAFVAAAVFAAGDWWSRARKLQWLEYVCKPATLVALIGAAIALDPHAGAGDRRSWFVAALVFSLLGDVLLMLPLDLFVAGLAAFLVAHVCYLAGFWTDPPGALALVVAGLVVAVVIGLVAARILAAVRRLDDRSLLVAISVYITVIAAMLATAIATRNWVAGIGAALFAASDSLIAWTRFVRPVMSAAVIIMVTYHLGQAGLVLSLLR